MVKTIIKNIFNKANYDTTYDVLDLNKYKNDGWGLSRFALTNIYALILSKTIYSNHNIYNDLNKYSIVEFGSGHSTQFLVDLIDLYKLPVSVTSFDDSIEYSYKPSIKYDYLDLKIRSLLECSDEDYLEMLNNKIYDLSKMKKRLEPSQSRQKNCFYNINENDLPKKCDFCILDGPNGNGRNIAYLHLKDILDVDSHILIDDYNHYDFVETLKRYFNCSEVFCHDGAEGADTWLKGGAFVIYRISGKAR